MNKDVGSQFKCADVSEGMCREIRGCHAKSMTPNYSSRLRAGSITDVARIPRTDRGTMTRRASSVRPQL
jgi:hypothetical protein